MNSSITSSVISDSVTGMNAEVFSLGKKHIGTIYKGKNGYSVLLKISRKEVFHHARTYEQAKKIIMSHSEIVGNIHQVELKG